MLSDVQLTSMRALIVTVMDSETVIRRSGGDPVFNPDTGAHTPPASSEVYRGECHIRPTNVRERVVEFGGSPRTLRTYVVKLPLSASSAGISEGDEIEVTAVRGPTVSDLLGRTLRVLDAPGHDMPLSRVVIAEETV